MSTWSLARVPFRCTGDFIASRRGVCNAGLSFSACNDPVLREIEPRYGISYRKTLACVITLNAGIDVQDNVFLVEED